jgi:parvulin-like peptidyl-prolyl isomerase
MFRRNIFFFFLLAAFLLVACSDDPLETQAPAAGTPVVPTPGPAPESGVGEETVVPGGTEQPVEPTAIPPTPTPTEPMAALVNGQPIFLVDYEKELARFEQAQADLGLAPAGETDGGEVDYPTLVLDALIEKELITQAAEANGIRVTPAEADVRLAELVAETGGQDNFVAWLQSNQWTEEEFRDALAAEMLTERLVEFITADVPFAVEQVRARYIQVDDPALAQSILDQVTGGADFAALAQQHSLDRITGDNGGDLGFFAPGSLLVPEVEAAAFALQPGEVSGVIEGVQTDGAGTIYYLVQVIERDPERTLSADLRFGLLQEAFETWLDELWSQAVISRFPEPGP